MKIVIVSMEILCFTLKKKREREKKRILRRKKEKKSSSSSNNRPINGMKMANINVQCVRNFQANQLNNETSEIECEHTSLPKLMRALRISKAKFPWKSIFSPNLSFFSFFSLLSGSAVVVSRLFCSLQKTIWIDFSFYFERLKRISSKRLIINNSLYIGHA